MKQYILTIILVLIFAQMAKAQCYKNEALCLKVILSADDNTRDLVGQILKVEIYGIEFNKNNISDNTLELRADPTTSEVFILDKNRSKYSIGKLRSVIPTEVIFGYKYVETGVDLYSGWNVSLNTVKGPSKWICTTNIIPKKEKVRYDTVNGSIESNQGRMSLSRIYPTTLFSYPVFSCP